MSIIKKYNTIIGRYATITAAMLFAVIVAGLMIQKQAVTRIVATEIIEEKQKLISYIADDIKFEKSSAIYNIIENKGLLADSYLYIIDTDGILYFHPKNEFIGKDYSNSDFFEKIKHLKSKTGNIHYSFEGIFKVGVFQRIDNRFYVLTYNDSEIYAISRIFNKFVYIGMFVMIIVSFILIFFLEKIFTSKIIRINKELKEKSSGNFIEIPTFWYHKENSNDIFHSLTRYTIDLFNNIVKILVDIKRLSIKLETKFAIIKTTVSENDRILKETLKTVNNVENDVNNVVGVITDKFNDIQIDVNTSVDVVEREIYNQQAFTEESTAAVEEMVSNIRSINNNNDISKRKIDSLVSLGSSGLKHQIKLKGSVENTILSINELIETNKIITNISNQTTILSINAAIESAHAGEYGKGFGVVAEEIGKLADSSTKQSKAIDLLTKILLKDLNEMSLISNTTYKSYNDIIEVIKDVDRISTEISSSLQEQTSGSDEIVESMVELKDSFQNVNNAINKTSEANRYLKTGVEELNSSYKTIKNSMDELTSETNKTISSSNKIKDSIDDSADSLSDLVNDLKFFKIKKN